MKYLQLTIGTNVIRFGPDADPSPLIVGLANASVFEKDWSGKLTPSNEQITFGFVDPARTTENPALSAALREKETFTGYWQEAIKERDESRALVDALNARIDDLTRNATEVQS